MSRTIPFFDESLKLDYDIELVYVENPESSPDTTGITYVAQIHRSMRINGKLFFEVSLLTDTNGNRLSSTNKILTQNIISLRKHRTIKNRKLYHLEDEIVATNFANNDLSNKNPLESVSRSALGSGIYGRNLASIQEAKTLSLDNKKIYEIDIIGAFDIQDKEHGESITTASLHTNRYLDKIITDSNLNDLDNILEVRNFIKNDNIENLVILWNIVFYRNKRYISYDKLENILCDYLVEFFTNNEIMNDNTSLIALPINYIMKEMGYTGLIADDIYNNGWDRGCVSYIFAKSDKFRQGKAFY
jgi:hypothetical protein